MKKKMEFKILNSSGDGIIIRFYPKKSHVYGFWDTPPETWGEVYKTYLAYKIIRYNNDGVKETIFHECCDEDSVLNLVSTAIQSILDDDGKIRHGNAGKCDAFNLNSFGYSINWNIKDVSGLYEFTAYDCFGKGCRFNLCKKQLIKLKRAIDKFLDYMLEHSEGA